ncbi:MAG TPA: hypothetical protein VMU84_13185 [Thermoanaerobaculia bacterium]|nr:hypothetical protein [Thermoanaerobaculia bacterium]
MTLRDIIKLFPQVQNPQFRTAIEGPPWTTERPLSDVADSDQQDAVNATGSDMPEQTADHR